HAEENLPETLLGDPTRLTQILMNLINNSLKFTHYGTVETRARLISQQGNTANIEFTVSDTGIGIPKDKLPFIFDRFTQGDADTTRKYGGTGLGLSIVKKLVEILGGSIQVESKEGKGSTFTFTLPFEISPIDISEKYSDDNVIIPDTIKKKIKVLVAEDNIFNQKLAAALLKEWGLSFKIVENGKQAVENLKKEHYDLLLMDIQMPEMNGYEATQHIRQILKLQIPIIAMTAHVLAGEREKCILAGMNDYITKPIHENELYLLIRKYTNNHNGTEKNGDHSFPADDASGKITNLQYLKSLANGNQQFQNEMIDIFIKENPNEVSNLKKAIDEKNLEKMRASAHAMKSTLPFVGLDIPLKKILEDMEASSDLEKIHELFSIVESTCRQAAEELKGMQQASQN
ncbi:MAG TPA: ATP-binding protein, partial [Bacteroidia bacterium]